MNQNWKLFLAWRGIRSPKSSRFVTAISLFAILGTGAGVLALLVTLSVMNGFEDEMKKRLFQGELHALIRPLPGVEGWNQGYASSGPILKLENDPELRAAGFVTFHPVISTEAILQRGKRVNGVLWKGLGKTDFPGGVSIGRELADEMGLNEGDFISLISPVEMEGPLGSVPRSIRVSISHIYQSGSPEEELGTIYSQETLVRSFLKRREGISNVEVVTKDLNSAPMVATLLRSKLPGYSVRDWRELQAHLFHSLRIERIGMFIGLGFVIVVASFGIITILMLLVFDRRKEISILKAMGARPADLSQIFHMQGLLLGGAGSVMGALLGYGVCLVLGKTKIVELPEIYYDRTLPISMDAMYFFLIPLAALCIAFLASRYPAQRAAKLTPMDGIRMGPK